MSTKEVNFQKISFAHFADMVRKILNQSMNNRIGKVNELAWALGNILIALSVCFSAKSGFGVSMVVAPAYVLYLKVSQTLSWFTFGMAEYCFQMLLLLLLSIVMRKFKWKYLLTVITVVFYSVWLDIWQMMFGKEVYSLYWQRVCSGVVGVLIGSFAIALMLRTYLPQEAYEMVVKELAEKYHKNMNGVKWIYDVTSLGIAILMMLVTFHTFSFRIIGVYTIAAAAINAPLIAFAGRMLEKKFDFSPCFFKLYETYNRKVN